MCRMFLFLGNEVRAAQDLLGCLVKASSHDDLLPEAGARRRGHRRHLHGWGYVLLGRQGNDSLSLWEQRAKPVFEDDEGVRRLSEVVAKCETLALVAHSRLASAGGTERHRCHPFHFQTPQGVEFFLAHNGSMKEDPLRDALAVVPRGASDTMLLGHWLSQKAFPFSPELPPRLFSEAEPFTETAMNTFSLWLDGAASGLVAHVTSHVAASERSEEMLRYFELFTLREQCYEAWMSSTVARVAKEELGWRPESMAFETSVTREFPLR